MRHLFFAVAACVGLAACSTPQQIAERDDKDCQAKGNNVGTPGYVDCRAGLEKERLEDRALNQSARMRFIPGTPGAPLDGGG